MGEQVLWFDPDIKLPPGVVEELTWWEAGGNVCRGEGGMSCRICSQALLRGRSM